MTRPTQHRQVENFEPYPEASYANIDLTGLAAFAIKRLQELQIPLTFENLVVGLFKLFPNRFSLEGFSQFPDAARVGRTLLQLGPKYRNWARGSVQKGFILTESGAAKAAGVASVLILGVGAEEAQPRLQSRPRTMDLGREMSVIENSSLFKKWKAGRLSEGESIEFYDLLGAYAYTPARALRDRTQLLENAARDVGRQDILEFLRAVKQHFRASLS